jgi:DNA (cytosine-5)-methyltransferase 1
MSKDYISNSFNNLKKITTKPPKIISLFSGCGGLDYSFHKAGYELIWANDNDITSCETFKRNISDKIICNSIELINLKNLPKADLVLGGFPCQDFSQIWKKPGLNGTRGNLYSYFVEAVKRTKPKVFIAENVKGILSANKGLAIETIINDFRSLKPGYIVIPKLVNFSEYGLPQVRERVLIFGIRKDSKFDMSFPSTSHGDNKKKFVSSRIGLEGIKKDVPNQEHMKIQPRTVEILKRIPAGGNFTSIPKDDPYYVKGMISHVYRRLNPEEPSKTIIASGGGGTWGYHYPEPRALTNRERARLQGFPDNFEFLGKFGEIRRQIGNAVPPVGMIKFTNAVTSFFNEEFSKTNLENIDKEISDLSIKDLMKRTNSTFDFNISDLDNSTFLFK